MLQNNKLSIVTINYKNLNGLISTYNSIDSQNNRDHVEWIVIDGKSDDGTLKWLTNLSPIFPLKFISEKDSGIYNAMNKGVFHSRNEYTIFLNSGDTFIDKYSIDHIIHNIKSAKDIDLFLFGFKYINKLHFPRPLWWRYWSMPTSHQALVYSTKLLLLNLYNETYARGGDFEHLLRIVPKLKRFKSIPVILSINEEYGSNVNMSIIRNEYEQILSAHIPAFLSKILVNTKFFYLNLRNKLEKNIHN